MAQIPNGALRFVQHGCHAFADGEDGKKKLKMTVYSGKVIKDHFYWGDLAIDLDGIKFGMSKYPVLEQHDTDRRIAFTGKPIVSKEGGIVLDPNKTQFLDNEHSLAFQKDSAKGFPFQASMHAKPSAVETISDGEKAEVNGFTFNGPGTIWRKSEFKEASVCVFGWDSKTVSSAFSKDIKTEVEFDTIGGGTHDNTTDTYQLKLEEEVKKMPKTVEELSEKYPELAQKLTEEVVEGVTAKLTKKFNEEKDELKGKNDQLSKTVEEQGKSISGLEMKDIKRNEREMKKDADNIVTSKLAASDVHERLHDKIRKLFDHNKYVTDDKLDVDAFSVEIDAEIKEFEELGATSTVLGLGTSQRTDESPEVLAEKKADEEDDAAVDNLLKMAGEPVPKDET